MALEFSPEELAAIRSEYAKGATDSQFDLFIAECKARNLRPGQHLIFQTRRTKEYDATVGAQVFVQKPYWITTISALRLIIERTGKYAGQTPPEYIYLDAEGNPSVVSTVPLPQKDSTQVAREPWAVRVGIKRRDFDEPIVGMARFESVAGFTKTTDGYALTSMWAKRGPEMCAKCAEADGIRKAAPEEAGAYFIAEELKHEEEAPPPTEPVALAPAPSAPSVPKVDHTPAVPTSDPRPGEPTPTLVDIVLHKDQEVKPEPKKRGRKPAEIPVTGKPAQDRPDLGITDEDIANAHKPKPEFDEEANKREAMEFVEDVCGATPVPDRIPDTEQKKVFADRIRALATDGVTTAQIGTWAKTLTKKEKSGDWTNGDWAKIFEKLDAAAKAGTLKELVKQ